MDTSEYAVLVAGIALIAFVLWYFFGAKEKIVAGLNISGIQEVKVTVKGGYTPDVIEVLAGHPVKLSFYRDETSSCSEELAIRDFGILRALPAFRETSIEFTPEKAGTFEFTCGMNMLRGKLIVKLG